MIFMPWVRKRVAQSYPPQADYSAALFLGCSPQFCVKPGRQPLLQECQTRSAAELQNNSALPARSYFKNAKLEVPQSYRTTLRYLLVQSRAVPGRSTLMRQPGIQNAGSSRAPCQTWRISTLRDSSLTS